jgi:hypothetical protein
MPKQSFACYFSGSGYGESYDEDDDDEQYDTDSLENSVAAAQKDDENNIYKDMIKTRCVRAEQRI